MTHMIINKKNAKEKLRRIQLKGEEVPCCVYCHEKILYEDDFEIINDRWMRRKCFDKELTHKHQRRML